MKNYNIQNIQFYITYAFIFACVFFVGFDNMLLFKSTIPNISSGSLESIYSTIGISVIGLVIGLLLFRRLIKTHPLDYILKLSLLASALFSWMQFHLPSILDLASLHIQTITVFLTNISMGIFLYSSKMILKEKNMSQRNLTTLLLWIFFSIGLLAIANNLDIKGQGISIIISLTYTLGFICSMTLKGNDFMKIKNSNPYSYLGILIGIIYLTQCYFLFNSEYMIYFKNFFSFNFIFIVFASLLFWLQPSINKASVVIFLTLSQILS